MIPPIVLDPLSDYQKDYLLALRASQQKLGDVFRLALGKHALYFVAHPALAKEVLVNQTQNFAKLGSIGQMSGLQLILGEGLLTTTSSERWRKSRSLLQPLFHQRMVQGWSKTIQQASERLIERLQHTSETDIAQEMLDITAEILYQIMFSLSPQKSKQYPISIPLSLATAKRKVIREVMSKLEPVMTSLIEMRKAMRGQHQDILEFLLEAQDEDNSLSDQQLRDEVLTLFAAGHETMSYALAWTFYLLSQHPEIYRKLIDKTKHSSESLHPYAADVFKEALRLYPTIPAAPRVAVQNTVVGGFDIPKGARVLVSFYLIHRHQDYWVTPEQFNPERTFGEAYMPFGLGQRYCLGKNLAMLQGPLVLTQFAKHLRLELSQGANIQSKVAISLMPREGITMKVLNS